MLHMIYKLIHHSNLNGDLLSKRHFFILVNFWMFKSYCLHSNSTYISPDNSFKTCFKTTNYIKSIM